MEHYHLNFLLIDPCPLAGTQFTQYAERLNQTAVQLYSIHELLAEGFSPPNAVVYAWQMENGAANETALAVLRQRFVGVPLVVSTKPEGLTAVAQLPHIHSYILHPYISNDIERLVEQIHQREVSNRASDLHPLLAEMVNNPDEPISLHRLTNLLVNRFGYGIAMCHVMPKPDLLVRHSYAGIVAHEALTATKELQLGEGIVGEVALTGTSKVIYDLTTYPDFQATDLIAYEGAVSLLALPLKLRQDVVGVLSCFTRSPHSFTAPEITFLADLANLAALEWNNSQQRKQWHRLEKAGNELLRAQQLQGAVRLTMEHAVEIAEANGANVCFYSASQGGFLNTQQMGMGLGRIMVEWASKHPEWSQLHQQILVGEPLLVPDVAAWPDFPLIQAKMLRHGVRAFIALPLRGAHLAVGILFVFYRRVHPYALRGVEHAARHPLNIFAEMSALVMERAYHQEQERKGKEMVQLWTEKTSAGLPMQGEESRLWLSFLDRILLVTGAERGAICLLAAGGKSQRCYNRHMPKHYIEAQLVHPGNSLEKMAATSKETLILSDLQPIASNESLHQVRDAEGRTWEIAVYPGVEMPRSRLVAPVRRGRELVGLVVLESMRPLTFNQDDRRLVDNLAQHMGIAISYDTLMRKLGEGTQRFPVIQLIRPKLAQLLDKLRRQTACDVVTLFLYSPYWQTFQLPMSSGELRFATTAFGFDSKKLQQVVEVAAADGVVTNMDLIGSAFPLFIQREGIQGVWGYGLKNGRSEPVGLLVLHYRDTHHLTPAEATFIQATVNQMACLIEQAYFSPKLVDILRDAFNFDLVRLHLFKQKEDRWSSPITAGDLRQPHSWSQIPDKNSPITYALQAAANGGKPYRFVNRIGTDPILTQGDFTKREGIGSGGYVLLEVENEVVGILFFNWRRPHNWTEIEKNAVLIFAKQAALGIYNRDLVMQLKEEGVRANWIQRIVGAVIKAGFNQKTALDAILEQAMAITQAAFGVIRLVDEKEPDWVDTVAVSGIQGDEAAWHQQHGRVQRSDRGISLLAMRRNHRLYVRDVKDPEYRDEYVEAADGHMRSEIAVVLRHTQTGEPIGVIDVEHPEEGGLTLASLERLTTFAEVASIVLHNVKKDDDLLKAKEEMAHVEALAWRGMFGSNWWHTACQKTSSIKALLLPLQRQFAADAAVLRRLNKIQELVAKIEKIPEMGWIPNEMEVEPVPLLVEPLVKTAVSEATRSSRHLHLVWKFQSPATLVAVHEKLFCQAIKNLVENAVRAMGGKGTLTIVTTTHRNRIDIDLIDTGPGIPPAIRPLYLHQRIPQKSQPQGTGLGGYIASFVFARYHGKATVTRSDPTGTHIKITLPAAPAAL